ncbi:DUF4179 domain-containing protein [Bacillus sp. SM2101]|uniref:DUF4179 domain-containing protein n=1 Tax=Bacillus sp. SM2101 TaxID=2805366 RepID=UPI001BDEAFC6|nr:DUF4179 domain-containing protein [Bacillus sp. SM2101]
MNKDFEKEEAALYDIKDKYDHLSIPEDLDQSIRNGMNKATKSRRINRRMRLTSISACILILSFVTTVRISPAFANYMSTIPGLAKIVELIQFDQSLQVAVENEFIQHIGASEEQNGVTFTIDAVIVDESKMVMFYTLENVKDYNYLHPLPDLLTSEGKDYLASSGSDNLKNKQNENSISGRFDFYFHEAVPTEGFILQLIVEAGDDLSNMSEFPHEYSIPFQVNTALFENMKELYEINETVEVEGQKITFKTLEVYPTQLKLQVTYDKNNTMKIFELEDLRIVDENGDEVTSIANGITGSNITEYGESFHLESNYFKKPKELYIEFTAIRALDKNLLDLQVDVENRKIVKAPDDRIYMEPSYNNEKEQLVISFDKDDLYSGELRVDWEFVDGDGKKYKPLSNGYSMGEANESLVLEIPNENYNNPLVFTISDYPTRKYTKDIRLKVK